MDPPLVLPFRRAASELGTPQLIKSQRWRINKTVWLDLGSQVGGFSLHLIGLRGVLALQVGEIPVEQVAGVGELPELGRLGLQPLAQPLHLQLCRGDLPRRAELCRLRCLKPDGATRVTPADVTALPAEP